MWYTIHMFEFLRKKTLKNKGESEVVQVAEKQLEEKRAIIESLRDYDSGKKDIPTRDVERRLPGIRVAQ